jgi:predicted dehydrogenase
MIQIGIAGIGGRGGSFKQACLALGVHIRAVCDTNPQRLAECAAELNAEEQYLDYAQMLEQSALDAVIIGTPMYLHAQQSIMALQRGLHVLCEVTPAVSLDECRSLVQVCQNARGVYRLAENCNLMKPNLMVTEMVRQGVFGQTYYAAGEYLHELRDLNERTPWRRQWQTGINGVTYGTHSLGPILQWMPGDRVVQVCCTGSGHHYRDARATPYENEDSCLMLCKMQSGAQVEVRVDMLSSRPYGLNFALQGTEGAYESARHKGDLDRVWLRARAAGSDDWLNLADLESEFLPAWWREQAQTAENAGHGGSDYFVVYAFLQAIAGQENALPGIHAAMDMTLPGLVSQQSIVQNSVWLEVPDSRTW